MNIWNPWAWLKLPSKDRISFSNLSFALKTLQQTEPGPSGFNHLFLKSTDCGLQSPAAKCLHGNTQIGVGLNDWGLQPGQADTQPKTTTLQFLSPHQAPTHTDPHLYVQSWIFLAEQMTRQKNGWENLSFQVPYETTKLDPLWISSAGSSSSSWNVTE